MSVDPFDTGGATRKRRPALRGTVMLDVSMGKARVRVWPKARGKAKTAEAKHLQDRFRQASWACKYWDPRNIVSVDELRKGTPVLIRDLQIMMMYGRFANFSMTDGRMVYTVQARQDVSDALDTICPLPGALLIRTPDGWRFVEPPTSSGKPLVSTADGLAEWSPTNIASDWGDIGGNINDQTDLQAEFASLIATMIANLALKQNTGTALLIAQNLADLADAHTARGNLSVYSQAEINALLATGGSGGAITTLGAPDGMFTATNTPATNQYLMAVIVADHPFVIRKIACYAYTASPTAKIQPFVYQCNAAFTAATALLASGPQQTGLPIGYNEIPLTTPVTVAKGQAIWLGLNVTVATLTLLTKAGGVNAVATNGGSTVPANPAPAITTSAVFGQLFGLWGV